MANTPSKKRRWNLISYSLLAFLAVFLLWPIFLIVKGGFVTEEGSFTLQYLLSIFDDPLKVQGLINSLKIALATTAISLAIALPLAIIFARLKFPFQNFLGSLLLMPMILPPFVGAIGVDALFGRYGSINMFLGHLGLIDISQGGFDFLGGQLGGRFLCIVVVEALHLYPMLYLSILAALANIDPALEDAAASLGASKIKRLFKITLPLIIPGIFSGSILVLIWSFTELGTPLVFDYNTVTPVQIFWGVQEIAPSPQVYALVVVMLIVATTLYAIGKFILGKKSYAMTSKASVAAQTTTLTKKSQALVVASVCTFIFIATLPHLGVIIASFCQSGHWYQSLLPQEWTLDHYESALKHPLAVSSIENSLFFAFTATSICMVLGLLISYITVRVKPKFNWLIDALAMLPLAVPGLVMAFGYVAMSITYPFGKGNPLGEYFSVVGQNPSPAFFLITAYMIRRLPYVVRSVSAGLEQTHISLEEAAQNLGAPPLKSVLRIVVPLIMANIIAGGILAFSFSMLEVSDSLILAQKESDYPVTKAIYDFYQRLGDGPYVASAMGVWAMALLATTLIAANIFMGKKLGAMFRV